MSARTRWISKKLLSTMEPEVVARIAKALGGHDQIAEEYACNVESALRDRGKHALATEWLEEVESCIVVR